MARPAERFVESLDEEQQARLGRLWREDGRHRVRCRAHAVLLSHQGVSVTDLCKIFDAARSTISRWLDHWEQSGLQGLEDEDHPGRPPLLDGDERARAVELLEEHPRRPDRVREEIERQTGKSISRRTLRRIARAANLTWKRMRRSVAGAADESEEDRKQRMAQAKSEISELRHRQADGEIDLYFFDEVRFDLTPTVPYGWQRIGQTRRIPSSKGGAIQTLGFMTTACQLHPYCVEGAVDSEIVTMVFDDFAQQITRPAVVVLDNAPVHTSATFQSRREAWSAAGLELYSLPSYCPELNLIERLWRAIKQRWLPLDAYQSFTKLKTGLESILSQIGSELTLNFTQA